MVKLIGLRSEWLNSENTPLIVSEDGINQERKPFPDCRKCHLWGGR